MLHSVFNATDYSTIIYVMIQIEGWERWKGMHFSWSLFLTFIEMLILQKLETCEPQPYYFAVKTCLICNLLQGTMLLCREGHYLDIIIAGNN